MKAIPLLLLAALASRATADPAQAELLFREGMTLLDAGKLAEACDVFAASRRAGATINVLVNEAVCRERNNQLATAWGLYNEAARLTRGAADQTSVAVNQLAIEKAAQLEPRISKLTISVPSESRIERLTITHDGVPVDETTWNRSTFVDGGRVTITARAPGTQEWSTTLDVGIERDVKTVEIPKLQTVVVPKPVVVPPIVTPIEQPRRSHTNALIAGGVALIGIGLGVGLELSARSTYDRAEQEPDKSKRDSLWHSSNTRRYLAEASAIAGLGCAGVAVWMYVRGRRADDRRIAVQPIAGANRAGIALTRSF